MSEFKNKQQLMEFMRENTIGDYWWVLKEDCGDSDSEFTEDQLNDILYDMHIMMRMVEPPVTKITITDDQYDTLLDILDTSIEEAKMGLQNEYKWDDVHEMCDTFTAYHNLYKYVEGKRELELCADMMGNLRGILEDLIQRNNEEIQDLREQGVGDADLTEYHDEIAFCEELLEQLGE